MWVFMVTTPRHDNCLPGETMHTKHASHVFFFFFSHSTELKHKSCIYRQLILIKSQKVNTDLSHIFTPLSRAILVPQNEAGVDIHRNLL